MCHTHAHTHTTHTEAQGTHTRTHTLPTHGRSHIARTIQQGNEIDSGIIESDMTASHSSYQGHVFTARDMEERLLGRFTLRTPNAAFKITTCEGYVPKKVKLFDEVDAEAIVGVIHDQGAPCEGDDSSQWSCIRHVTKEEHAARNKLHYGFQEGEVRVRRGFPVSCVGGGVGGGVWVMVCVVEVVVVAVACVCV